MAVDFGTYRLLTAAEIFHMPQTDGAVVRQEDTSLHGEEAVDLHLRAELTAEGLDVHGREAGVGLHRLVAFHLCVSFF